MYKPERYGTPGLLDMISPHPRECDVSITKFAYAYAVTQS
jgi:hypothetical protein